MPDKAGPVTLQVVPPYVGVVDGSPLCCGGVAVKLQYCTIADLHVCASKQDYSRSLIASILREESVTIGEVDHSPNHCESRSNVCVKSDVTSELNWYLGYIHSAYPSLIGGITFTYLFSILDGV